MAYTPKDWRDATTYSGGGDTSTPISAASLEDLEIRVTDYADGLVSPSPTASDILFGFADDEDNHQDFYADALATGCNSARIGVGYNAPGSAASLAAVAAYEADDQIDQVVVYLWSSSTISAATWATQAALACVQYPNALIELINEPNLNSFGPYTWQQAADATIAAVNACPAGRIIGPAVSQIGEQLGGDYLSYQAQMYDRIFDSVSPAQMAGVAFHLYPVTSDPVGEMETHVDACYTAGLEQLPVFITEVGYQWGIYNLYQGWSSANLFNTYYNDERVGGIFYYRLAPQQPTPLEGETFQRYPLTTNQALDDALTEAFNDPPGGDPAPYAPLDSPTFTGDPKAPTPLPGDNDTSLATTQFVTGAIGERLFRPEDYDAAGDGVTDDTAALQECIDAALAYDGMGTVQFAAKTYLVSSAVRTDRSGRCQVSIFDALNSQTSIQLRGAAPAAAVDPAYIGDALAGNRTIIKSTLTGLSYSGTFGPPSVIGGGTEENGITEGREYTGIVRMRDLIVQIPANSTIAGIDAMTFGGLDAQDCAVVAGDPDTATTTVPTNIGGFGWRLPSVWANNTIRIKGVQAINCYAGFVLHHADHHFYEAAVAYYCNIGFAFQTATSAAAYPIVGHYWMIEGCPYSIAGYAVASGLADIDQGVFFADMIVQTEHSSIVAFNPVQSIRDPSNLLRGRISWHHWALGALATLPGTLNGAAKLDIRTPYSGHVSVSRSVVPADAEVNTGEAQFWHDISTAGLPRVMAKVKDGAGTVKNYSIVGGDFTVWKTIATAKGWLHDGMLNGFPTVVGALISDDTNNTVRQAISSEGMVLSNDHQAAAALAVAPADIIYIDDAHFANAATALTPQLRIIATIMVNATAPAVNFTITLVAVDSSGAGDTLAYNPGSSSGSVAINAPGASNPTTGTSSGFAVPADGAYHFTTAVSGTPTSGFAGSVHIQLQLAHSL